MSGQYGKTLYGMVERNARIVGERLAVKQGPEGLTWREFLGEVNRCANFMLDAGVGRGDSVGVMLRNCPEFIEVYAGAPAIGARPFNVNYRYLRRELRYVLSDAGAVLLFVDPEYEDVVEAVRDDVPSLKAVIVCGHSRAGNLEWDQVMPGASPLRPEPPWGPGEDSGEIILYTGGTTGMPKGVLWPQENLVAMVAHGLAGAFISNLGLLVKAPPPAPDNLLDLLNLPLRRTRVVRAAYLAVLKNERALARAVSFFENKVLSPPGYPTVLRKIGESMQILIVSPLMHGTAWGGVLPVLGSAGSIHLLPDSPGFDPHMLLSTIQRDRVRIVIIVGDAFAVPMVEALEEEDYDLGSLVVLGTGAVRLSPRMKKVLHDKLPGALVVDTLLATEGGGSVSEVSISSAAKEHHRFQVRSTGSFPVAVIDGEGCFVKPGSGAVGRLAYGGAQSTGYLNDPDRTAATRVEAGGRTWLVTGDLCRVEVDGTIELVGREQACINTGGEKVYPYEVEDVVSAHHAVRDVAIVGVPHPRWGEAVTAVVELSGGSYVEGLEDELSKLVHRGLSDFKCPKYWVFVDSLGRSATGKLNYETLRRRAIERLGPGEGGERAENQMEVRA
ncbi:MAG: AMP-binding protein [Actinobacteria bacterium]|nr:AMP-binding protein [Actinomycetota bacterium]MBU1943010.1 AMP-binding protein [Actinomycetota bacterium]MBU2687750.1 AMP-binding protein [Actinomycetota bacterium]